MKFVFAIIALGLPALELAGIYQVWQAIGAWTLLWLLAAVLAGVWLLRLERLEFLPRLMYSAFEGTTPLAALWASGRRVLAALLLIFPGLLSDIVALVLLAWPSPPGPPRTRRTRGPQAANDDVIEGEFRRVDD